jgi:hypothetical protein
MGWMDAYDYLVMERTLLDRLEEVERFSLEQAFHSEAIDAQDAERSQIRARPSVPRSLSPTAIR